MAASSRQSMFRHLFTTYRQSSTLQPSATTSKLAELTIPFRSTNRFLRASKPLQATALHSRQLCTLRTAIVPLLYRSSHPPSNVLYFSTFRAQRYSNMASDEEYMNFLDKANQDPSAGVAKPQQQQGLVKAQFTTTDVGVEIPAPLKEVTKNAFYTSDADEPFVPVALNWDEAGKGLPDEEEIARLINHPDPANAQVEILDPVDWDTQGQYKDIIDAVTKAGKGNDVRVYRISKGGVRAEYWVVTTEGKGKDAKLVGVKALAIES